MTIAESHIRQQVGHVLSTLAASAAACDQQLADDPLNTHASLMASTYRVAAQVVRDELGDYLPEES